MLSPDSCPLSLKQVPTNILDFTIVVSSILELILYSQPWIKIFRALRALRPLRLLSHSKGMMKVFSSVFQSMFAMGGVSFVWLLVGLDLTHFCPLIELSKSS